eukprot:CAMPEP_0172614144 /NCGR_PEP_ID=MMETSP1068-20121228/49228_1 /TAXON_ID=35684 /ORGANISM="Pseudopedinella elastica, Strain CCMP716" /LENGTH=101 /DNA_ID=CAMNT_0013418843 /DNA_START=81 /DNA_END=383 /DNA_ORIENTATION=+
MVAFRITPWVIALSNLPAPTTCLDNPPRLGQDSKHSPYHSHHRHSNKPPDDLERKIKPGIISSREDLMANGRSAGMPSVALSRTTTPETPRETPREMPRPA